MPDLPVLVVSCDRYQDLWRPFFDLFWRHWPDCTGPVYLGTNFSRFDDPRVRTLAIGEDVTWSGSLRRMLDGVHAERVIVMLEDFFLTEPVNDARIRALHELSQEENLGCLRLYSIYPPDRLVPGRRDMGRFEPGDRWRVTAQAAIWSQQTLRRLLVPGFSAWDFEMLGSQMSDYLPDRIWGVMQPALVYDHAVEKGRWRPQGLEICRRAGINPDLASRGVFSEAELAKHDVDGRDSAEFAEHKTAAIQQFRRGRRRAGLGEIRWCLTQRPASVDVWAIAMAGLIGARATVALHRAHLWRRCVEANRTYRRALREAAARPIRVTA